MKPISLARLAALILATLLGFANGDVLYTFAGPQTVSDTWNFALPGLSLSRGATATGTLYFKYTVTHPASNKDTENYYAGMSFFDQGNEHLGIGNGWEPWAYSAFGPNGNLDLKSATPEPGTFYQLVRATDTTTIVIRVDFKSGANDNITVWLNPDFALSEAAQDPALTTTFTANADFDAIYLREGGNNGSGWTYTDVAIAEQPTDDGFFATPSTWDGGGADSLWSTAANWLGDVVPSADCDLVFPGSGNTSPVNDLAAGTSFSGLTFAAAAASYTLSGSSIALSNRVRNNSSHPHLLALPIELEGPLTFATLNSSLSIGGAISGPHGITKTGGYRLELTADNSYTGTTSITDGTLAIGNGGSAGSLDPTGTLGFGAGIGTRLEFSRPTDLVFSNPITTGGRANVAVLGAQTVTLDGPITGGGEFWTYGPGTVRITPNAGSASFTPTVVNVSGVLEVADFTTATLGTSAFCIGQGGSGTLRYTGATASTGRVAAHALQGNGTNSFIEISSPATELTLTQPLGNNAPLKGLTKTGPGSLILAVSPTYTGDTVVAEGELSLTQAGFSDSSTVTVSDNGQLKLDFPGSDTVAGIVLGSNVLGPGTYSASTHPDFLSGTGSLVIPSYPAWIASFTFAPGADLTQDGDPDADGISNLLEFALDGDPSISTASGKVRERIEGGYLTLTLPVRLGATFAGTGPVVATLPPHEGLVYSIEGSADLVTFEAEVVELDPPLGDGLPALGSGWSYRSFRLASPVSAAPAGFLRPKVTTTP